MTSIEDVTMGLASAVSVKDEAAKLPLATIMHGLDSAVGRWPCSAEVEKRPRWEIGTARERREGGWFAG